MSVRTVEAVSRTLTSQHPDQRTFTFCKEENTWTIDLPEYLAAGGNKEDLRMKAGAAGLLQLLGQGAQQLTLTMDTEPFKGAEAMELIDLCSAPKGGGIYLVEQCNGVEVNAFLWVCDIALFVFGDLPAYIYFQLASSGW